MSSFPPVYSINASTASTLTGAVLDMSSCSDAWNPPAMQLTISATATVIWECSHDLVNWSDFSAGGYTTNQAIDVVLSFRYWRARITANSGTVTSVVGPVSTRRGGYLSPNLLTVSTMPTGI